MGLGVPALAYGATRLFGGGGGGGATQGFPTYGDIARQQQGQYLHGLPRNKPGFVPFGPMPNPENAFGGLSPVDEFINLVSQNQPYAATGAEAAGSAAGATDPRLTQGQAGRLARVLGGGGSAASSGGAAAGGGAASSQSPYLTNGIVGDWTVDRPNLPGTGGTRGPFGPAGQGGSPIDVLHGLGQPVVDGAHMMNSFQPTYMNQPSGLGGIMGSPLFSNLVQLLQGGGQY